MTKTLRTLMLLGLTALGLHTSQAQSPGLIVRPAGGGPPPTALNPNGDDFSSETSAGFTTDDVAESEIPFAGVPVAIIETSGDPINGTLDGFTDIVTGADGLGFYLYANGDSLFFRLRIDDISSGAKGYSVLIDTDGKIGNSGAAADPNYVAPSGTSPGNPGFEYEVSFQTGGSVVVYNVDGTATPVQVASYPLNTHSQISVALSSNNGHPDYFYDWYVPLSIIGDPASIRVVATTLAGPGSAFLTPRSDVYGIPDAGIASTALAWELAAEAQPSVNLTVFTGIGANCTAAPTLNSPISTGTNVVVSGTWTAAFVTSPQPASVILYRNGVPVDTADFVGSGATWMITVPTVVAGDVFYATAVVATGGEAVCGTSNLVRAACTTQTSLTQLTISCATDRGFQGTAPVAAQVRIYTVTATGGYVLFADQTTTTLKIIRPMSAPNTWYYVDDAGNANNPCGSNPADIPSGSYVVTIQSSGQCESDFSSPQCINVASTATPVITQATLYPTSTTISGTATAGSTVRLFINGNLVTTTAATGGAYSFTSPILNVGDTVEVSAQATGLCESARVSRIVACIIAPPAITTNNTGNLVAGVTVISGTSTVPGATVQLYTGIPGLGIPVGVPATVGLNGSWSDTTLTLLAGQTYFATQTFGGCTSAASAVVSALVPTECPAVFGNYAVNDPAVFGTFSSPFTGTVFLYQDGALIDTQMLANSPAFNIAVPPNNPLYFNGRITVTAQALGEAESTGCPVHLVSECAPPATPVVTPTFESIDVGETVTFTVSNVTANLFYSLLDPNGVEFATTVFQSGTADFEITTFPFTMDNTAYTLVLTADPLTGCPAATVTVTVIVGVVLPVEFIRVDAVKTAGGNRVSWEVTNEVDVRHYEVEKSLDGAGFQAVGWVDYRTPSGAINQYSFLDNAPAAAPRVYYRIRQVDHDGDFLYSPSVAVDHEAKTGLTVLPNPLTDRIMLLLTAGVRGEARVELLDLNGRIAVTRHYPLEQGFNTLDVENLGGLERGTWLLKVTTAEGTTYRTLVLQ